MKKETPVPECGTGVFLSWKEKDSEKQQKGEKDEKRRNLRGSRGKN